jgi:hypothetical protein
MTRGEIDIRPRITFGNRRRDRANRGRGLVLSATRAYNRDMEDLFAHEVIRTLLTDIEQTTALIERMRRNGSDPSEVRQLLDGMYVDLGREVYAAWATGRAHGVSHAVSFGARPDIRPDLRSDLREITDVPDDPAPTARPPEGTDPNIRESWYTDEVDVETEVGPLFAPGEAISGDDLPGRVVAAELDDIEEIDIEEIDPSDPLAGMEWPEIEGGTPPSWLLELEQTLETLTAPPVPNAPDEELIIEMTRVQWGVSEIEDRFAEWPRPIRVAMLALLGSRARLLEDRSPGHDVRPRLMIDRLRRIQRQAGLPPTQSLLQGSKPETGDWATDAIRWWTVLGDGLRTVQ